MRRVLLRIYDELISFLFPIPREILPFLQNKNPLFKAINSPSEWIIPIYDYGNSIIKKVIQNNKTYIYQEIIEKIAELMKDAILDKLFEISELEKINSFYLIPIPMHSKNVSQRGFNQVCLIGREISKKINFSHIYSEIILTKIKETIPQKDIRKRKTRIKNIRGSFSCTEKMNGSLIILIDDVTTTGSTLKEASSVLLKSGARKIIAFAFAH
jgi:ComF family protein